MTGGDLSKYNKYGGYRAYEEAYNPRVHGPYYPWREYGKTPRPSIWTLKIGNLWSHFMQSDRSPQNIRNIISKSTWRVLYNRTTPQHSSMKGLYQVFFILGMTLMVARINDYAAERRCKYHW